MSPVTKTKIGMAIVLVTSIAMPSTSLGFKNGVQEILRATRDVYSSSADVRLSFTVVNRGGLKDVDEGDPTLNDVLRVFTDAGAKVPRTIPWKIPYQLIGGPAGVDTPPPTVPVGRGFTRVRNGSTEISLRDLGYVLGPGVYKMYAIDYVHALDGYAEIVRSNTIRITITGKSKS